MKINNKKELAARTLGIGKSRILFNNSRLSEIKDAITKNVTDRVCWIFLNC